MKGILTGNLIEGKDGELGAVFTRLDAAFHMGDSSVETSKIDEFRAWIWKILKLSIALFGGTLATPWYHLNAVTCSGRVQG